MRTRHEFRKALARVVHSGSTKETRLSGITNVILGEIDTIIENTWSDVSDMGVSVSEFKKVIRLVKKRL